MISSRNIGDQEVEYIYGMAFVENMVDLRNRKDFTLCTPHPTQKLLESVLPELEQLKTILTKRYEDTKKTTKKVVKQKNKDADFERKEARIVCKICLEVKDSFLVFNPCGHYCCSECYKRLCTCHLCRGKIESTIKLFP